MNKSIRVIISGGGTGGHIYPAIAIAHQIKVQYPLAEVLFVGAEGRMEMEKVPAEGYRIVGLPVAGLQRKAWIKNLGLPLKIAKSLNKARKILREFGPDIAIGVGGYASGPLLWMAARKKIPCLIQEQNSYAGITNKLLAKKVTVICTAYPNMERFFPKEKIRLTGNPVRSTITTANSALRQEGKNFFGIAANRLCILVTGGSLGARTLNRCIQAYREQEGEKAPVDIIWQCGAYYREECQNFVQNHPAGWLHLHPFIQRMDLAFAAADVVISRSGAGVIAELCIAGKAVIFVPSPNVSEDHQTHNAMALVRQEAALIVTEKEAPARLMQAALALAFDTSKRDSLARIILQLAKPDAAKEIVNQINNLIDA
ncbi:MAG: undecaprenyldiphospho-muramoylpentapeptide beta-N-acetylglucosaminyltransferase [Bacteroidetes bacterium]|nr:undecaprenyldiphospho-muramoylpentapeptide beta-N-acetylglucosaminyltransferase [Bacteroidota bacterium]